MDLPLKCLRSLVAIITPFAVLAILAAPLLAASPDAGTLLQGVEPAPTLPPDDTGVMTEEEAPAALQLDDQFKIAVTAIRFTGATAIPVEQLRNLTADAVGRELTLADLQDYADRITRCYRDTGYLLARAYLPAQKIENGVVEIAVLEGRLGKLQVKNGSSLSDKQVKRRLTSIREGEALTGTALERELLLLRDLPGLKVSSTLKPGASVGTTDLDVRLESAFPYAGTLEIDNYGNRNTGTVRLGGSLTAGNLTGRYDTLSLHAVAARDLAYGRLAWQLPVGSRGTQIGAAGSYMHYRLGEDFKDLDAHGTAGIGSAYLLHPLVRSRNANLNLQLFYEHKRLADDIDATATKTRKTLNVWTLGLSGERLDGLLGGGANQGSISLTAGELNLDDAGFSLDQSGYKTSGSYWKLGFNAARRQRLPGNFSLHANLQGQLAGNNLDSAEKMSLGGPRGVRAYPADEAVSDDAWLGTLELRYLLFSGCQASLFYDGAQGWLNHNPLAGETNNKRNLSGYGVGLNYAARGFSLQAGVAWRNGSEPTSGRDRSPRAWGRFVKQF